MKIIDRETFKRMPKGTVFCKFPRLDERTRTYCKYPFSIQIQKPCVLSGPLDADFGYTPVGSLEACAADDDSSNMAILVDMERHPGKEYPFEHWTGRDGMYEENDQVGFAIYSRQEVQQMIDLLQQALKDGYSDSPDVADPLDDITLRPGATVTLPLPQSQGESKPLLMALDWCDADLVRRVLSEKIVSLLCQQNGFMADPEMRRLASAIERMSKICDYINEYQQSATLSRMKVEEWTQQDDAIAKEIIAYFRDGTVKLQHDLNLYATWLEKLVTKQK